MSQDHQLIIEHDEISLDSNSDMENNYDSQSNHDQLSLLLQSAVNTISTLSDNAITSIKGRAHDVGGDNPHHFSGVSAKIFPG